MEPATERMPVQRNRVREQTPASRWLLMPWTFVFQVVVILIALTFCILMVQSFASSSNQSRTENRVIELRAERELVDAKAHLIEVQRNNGGTPSGG